MRKAIIIPVYLRLKGLEELHELEGLRLVKRAIESINLLKDKDFTLILPVCFDPWQSNEKILFQLESFFREEIRPLKSQKTLIFSSFRLKDLREYLIQKNFRDFNSLIDLKGFSKIRNTALLLAQALSMDVAVFIDFDEIIEDSNYLEIACEYLNQKWNGKLVSGKGGFYINPNGSILISFQNPWWRFFWNKNKLMNQVWQKILSSEDRLVPTPMLLGGNLILSSTLFSTIPFDPYIPRGEDTDYLINASQLGFYLLFDKKLRVKHLHPERTSSYFHEELQMDIERFLYERDKLKEGLTLNLNPYPGYFLKWTLYPKAILTSILISLDYMGRMEWKEAVECLANIGLLLQKKDEVWVRYLRFKRDWEMVMEKIRQEGMGDLLKNCWI